MILWMVEQACSLGLAHVYPGYWINGSAKMEYKARFRLLEALEKQRLERFRNIISRLFALLSCAAKYSSAKPRTYS